MKVAGWQAVGIDICAAALTCGRASYGVNLCRADAWGAPFRPATFDAIHAAHVIEHVLQPDRWLRALHVLLRPGGMPRP